MYLKGLNGRKEEAVRHTQIMSIFGVGDWRSDFFSEFLPEFTTWQSKHGWAPSKVSAIAWHKGARFEYSISMFVHANDWSATQCNPIAQQSVPIVAMRPIWRSTIARLGLANFDVNHCFAPAFGAKAPLPSSRYIVEPTREIRSDCRQIPAAKSFLASIVFASVFPVTGT